MARVTGMTARRRQHAATSGHHRLQGGARQHPGHGAAHRAPGGAEPPASDGGGGAPGADSHKQLPNAGLHPCNPKPHLNTGFLRKNPDDACAGEERPPRGAAGALPALARVPSCRGSADLAAAATFAGASGRGTPGAGSLSTFRSEGPEGRHPGVTSPGSWGGRTPTRSTKPATSHRVPLTQNQQEHWA